MKLSENVLGLSERITCLPIVHGNHDFALEVRRLMLSQQFDCVAVPLPPSFQDDVERGIAALPRLSLVLQREPPSFVRPAADASETPEGTEDTDAAEGADDDGTDIPIASYVPIDPCQGVIAALRMAMEERIPRAFVDCETSRFAVYMACFPDPYALKQVSPEQFAAAILPTLPTPARGQPQQRIAAMAARLRELEQHYRRILWVGSMLDWPWLRAAYFDRTPAPDDEPVEPTEWVGVRPETSLFVLGELPYVTGLCEQARRELDSDENLSVDGVKSLLLATRDQYKAEFGKQARAITPKLLRTYCQYVRNLSLLDRRLTPSLYHLVTAAQQIFGDQFAIVLMEQARQYPFGTVDDQPEMRCSIHRGRLPDGTTLRLHCRLPGMAVSWKSCTLKPKPLRIDQQQWAMRWNPYRQCSWPPEDIAIEKFRTHVKDTALALLGHDLARSEKFQTSLKDGLDIRETLRNWHTGELYVKVLPPNRGSLDCVVMLFDSPADPRRYPWRVTWQAEHHDESTLALFATNFQQTMVGPGIGQAEYGGAVFLFPPRRLRDIWHDKQFDFADTLEERLLAAACRHAKEKHIAILSTAPPGLGWKQLARRYGKKLLHVPLNRFSQERIQQLRQFHVLNGTQIRSYAAEFIRKA
jgi:hypothetical protein